jgi:hypothetical protein
MEKEMREREFLENFKEHLKIPFSYRNRKKYRTWDINVPSLIGRGHVEVVKNYIIKSITECFCPFSWFTTYIYRRTDTWQKQVGYYKRNKFDSRLTREMIKIVKEYQPVRRKKK